jgi:isopenicillin-N epimerase
MDTKPDWQQVMRLFNYDREYVQLGSSQFIVSHPEPVRNSIDNLRKQLDENPVMFTEEKEMGMMQRVREIAAKYFAVPNADDISMTDSTTMGLGTIYSALNLQKGQEVLTTDHDHYSQHESIRQATGRSGGSYRRISLYQNLWEVTTEEISRKREQPWVCFYIPGF